MKEIFISLAELLANDNKFRYDFSSVPTDDAKYSLAKTKFNNLTQKDFSDFLKELNQAKKSSITELSPNELQMVAGGTGTLVTKLAATAILFAAMGATGLTSQQVDAAPEPFLGVSSWAKNVTTLTDLEIESVKKLLSNLDSCCSLWITASELEKQADEIPSTVDSEKIGKLINMITALETEEISLAANKDKDALDKPNEIDSFKSALSSLKESISKYVNSYQAQKSQVYKRVKNPTVPKFISITIRNFLKFCSIDNLNVATNYIRGELNAAQSRPSQQVATETTQEAPFQQVSAEVTSEALKKEGLELPEDSESPDDVMTSIELVPRNDDRVDGGSGSTDLDDGAGPYVTPGTTETTRHTETSKKDGAASIRKLHVTRSAFQHVMCGDLKLANGKLTAGGGHHAVYAKEFHARVIPYVLRAMNLASDSILDGPYGKIIGSRFAMWKAIDNEAMLFKEIAPYVGSGESNDTKTVFYRVNFGPGVSHARSLFPEKWKWGDISDFVHRVILYGSAKEQSNGYKIYTLSADTSNNPYGFKGVVVVDGDQLVACYPEAPKN